MKNLLHLLKPRLGDYFFIKHLRPTLRFVALVATPLCLVNSFIAAQDSVNFYTEWATRFTYSFLITYPQAVVYVSLVKWFDRKR